MNNDLIPIISRLEQSMKELAYLNVRVPSQWINNAMHYISKAHADLCYLERNTHEAAWREKRDVYQGDCDEGQDETGSPSVDRKADPGPPSA